MSDPGANDGGGPRRRLTGFDRDEDPHPGWSVVDDDVMGGRSVGGRSVEHGILVFAGNTNTDGGGFSSVRRSVEPAALSAYDGIELRARPDDRTYTLTLDDGVVSGERQVSHRSPIRFHTPGAWQTVSIPFDQLFAARFGRPIENLPFRKDLVTRVAILLSDGRDGPFRLEVDWIDLWAHDRPDRARSSPTHG